GGNGRLRSAGRHFRRRIEQHVAHQLLHLHGKYRGSLCPHAEMDGEATGAGGPRLNRERNMAKTPSNMIPLGTPAPDFRLPDTVTDATVSYADISGAQGTVVMFICNHCPYVLQIVDEIVAVAGAYQKQGIGFVAISSNDIEAYPDDAPDRMRDMAEQRGFPFPYLYDASQAVAKAYQAACTPDFYVFDEQQRCVYRGQFD